MNFNLLLENITNPALLFFVLGIVAALVKSDLKIPENSAKFISLYLLFAIGFNGGQELAHGEFSTEIINVIILALSITTVIPLFTFLILKKKLNIYNAGAIAASYGSVSAVTFITALSYLEMHNLQSSGYMIAIMALMESPAIIVGLILISKYDKENTSFNMFALLKHSFTNGSVLLIIGSLFIGFFASETQAQSIAPFTTDIFKGFLAIFLLDMGITSGRKLKDFFKFGYIPLLFSIVAPLCIGIIFSFLSHIATDNIADRFIITILAASASYIAVPATMRINVPKANTGIFIPMALAVTFPINITIGLPLFYYLVQI